MAKDTIRRVYWDSDLFIAWLQRDPRKAEKCEGVLLKAQAREIHIVTSAYTVTEVLGGGRLDHIPEDKREAIDNFFKNEFITVVNLDRQLAEYARQITWDYKVPKKDSIHFATALTYQIPVLQAFEEALLKLSDKIPMRGNKFKKLLVEEPNEPIQRRLFDVKPGAGDGKLQQSVEATPTNAATKT